MRESDQVVENEDDMLHSDDDIFDEGDNDDESFLNSLVTKTENSQTTGSDMINI